MNARVAAILIEVVRGRDGRTVRDVSESTKIPHSTVGKYLLALHRSGRLDLRKRSTNTGGLENVYWFAGGAVDIPPVPQTTEERVLEAVKMADEEIDSQGVADYVSFSVSTVQMHLKQLVDKGKISRKPKSSATGRSSHGKGYLYRYVGEAQTGVDGVDEADAWFLDEGMGEAIERNRPHWRIGELLTKEEREKWRGEGLHASNGRMAEDW